MLQATFSGETHLTVTKMLMAGYHPETEPYVRSILSAFRAFQLLNLRTKSRIFVPQGACLIGCVDETATLSYGEVFLQLTPAAGSRRFLHDGLSVFPLYYHGQKGITTRVITGDVVVAKNPCVHPGDVRILRAVDVPAFRHMVNCLVFPQNGHRFVGALLPQGHYQSLYYYETCTEMFVSINLTALPYTVVHVVTMW